MRYLITFSYDGSKYNGYQKQLDVNTVQTELEKALTTLNDNNFVSVVASGRTDACVHALNQKAHFDLSINITEDKLKMALNSLLPKYIYVKDAKVVDQDFHARFSTKTKEYMYKINIGEYNPIEVDYVYQYNKNLDIDKMKEAIKLLEGTHNFKSFASADDVRDNYERTIFKTSIELDNNIITISFVGNGFLRYMVRNMVGTLIEIGEGKRLPSDINRILEKEDRKEAGKTAPGCGLYLKEVTYK